MCVDCNSRRKMCIDCNSRIKRCVDCNSRRNTSFHGLFFTLLDRW